MQITRRHHPSLLYALWIGLVNAGPSSGSGPRCPGQVGGSASAVHYLSTGTDVHLILNATFPCEGNISAWLCHKPDDVTPVFVAVWRRLAAASGTSVTGSRFRLIGKNHIPIGYVGSHVFRIKRRYQIVVDPGDHIGYHYSLVGANRTEQLGTARPAHILYSKKFNVGAEFDFQPNGHLGHAVYRKDSVAAMLDYGQAPLSVKNELACEGQEVTLSCGPDQLLLVRTARYGVLPAQCGAPLAASAPTTCFRAVWHVVHTRCTGRSRCRFRVTEHVFGDPCPDQSQTLDLEYACVRGTSNPYPVLSAHSTEDDLMNNENISTQTSLQSKPSDRDTGHQLHLPVPAWDEGRTQDLTSDGREDVERTMPAEFTVPNEQKGAVVAGVLVGVAVLAGFLIVGAVVYRRHFSKQRRLQNAQSQLIDHHLRLNPTYLNSQSVEALRRACSSPATPGGTMNTLRARIHLLYQGDDHTPQKQPSSTAAMGVGVAAPEANAVNYEVVYDNMLLLKPQHQQWEDVASRNEYMNLSIATRRAPLPTNFADPRANGTFKAVGPPSVPSLMAPSPGPPKPPRVAPYALVRPNLGDTDTESRTSTSSSSDFCTKPAKFRVWTQTDDDYDDFSDDEGSVSAGGGCDDVGSVGNQEKTIV